ncbi:hypothetical protein Tco_0821870 [Tanacetum coccineum]|uniref:Uncharacterized protein n=1 Tax=Tanacetum coccineum TaxID=301880 RepID=A0ABQ5AEI8_9ASTR
MDDPNITMEEYIRLEEEKARRHAIVFNDTLTSEATLLCEPTVSSLNKDEIDFRISFDESDDEDYTILFDKNSFSYKMISVNDLKTDSENDNDKVNMPLLPSLEPTYGGGTWTDGRGEAGSGEDGPVGPREGNIDEYWWRIYEYGNLEVLES